MRTQPLESQLKASEVELENLAAAGDDAIRGSLIMEIRPGTGDEAALFAGELFDMYKRFADKHGWKYEVLDFNSTELGGLKEVVFSITGETAFQQLQFESGGPRATRAGNRGPGTNPHQHGHSRRVARSDRSRSRPPRRRHEDRHVPRRRPRRSEGQQDRKRHPHHAPAHRHCRAVPGRKKPAQDKAKAKHVLRSRIFEHKQQLIHDERSAQRRSLIGSGGRNERIRTYNFPQGRITDHRIGLTVHKIDQVIRANSTS